MPEPEIYQWPITKIREDDYLLTWIEAFLEDRKAQDFSPGTLYFYQKKLQLFARFCESQAVTGIRQIDPRLIRRLLLWLEETNHNPGGRHAVYRSVKTFLLWWEAETDPEGWTNPIRRVKAPKLSIEPLTGVELDAVNQMIATCERHLIGMRDRALLLMLLDTGARAAEMVHLNLEDIDLVTGEILIRQGKGRKPRMVFIGRQARRALRTYLSKRTDDNPAAWVDPYGERLIYWSMNSMLAQRAKLAGVKKPGLHDFRRAFALNFLRNGGDIYSLQLIMGHADLQTLRRYLRLTQNDLKAAHLRSGPVDHSDIKG